MQMEIVSRGRLRLESLSHRVQSWSDARKPKVYPDRPNPRAQNSSTLVSAVREMEEYLGLINQEWEFCISGLPEAQVTIATSQLPRLLPALVHAEEGGTFRDNFRGEYLKAIGALAAAVSFEED